MEINGLYEALGVSTGAEAEEAAPGTEEVADPTSVSETEGGTEQEVADPAAETEETNSGKGKQSNADNQRYARQRREREKQEAIEAARSEERLRIEQLLREAGLVDPGSKNGRIQSLEQLEQRAKSKAVKDAAKALSDNGELTDEQLHALMQSTESGRRMLRSNAEAQNEKLGVYRQQQIALISKLDPNVKTFEQLQQIPEYETFEKYVREHNLSWEDAYRLACGNRLTQKSAAAARQQALNQVGGKIHMTQDTAKGGAGVDVPKAVEDMYRAMNPGITHEQCVKMYNDYIRRTAKG